MKIVGYNITNLTANKHSNLQKSSINTNITFTDVQKEKIEVLKDADALKTKFKFTVEYSDQDNKESKNNEVALEGFLTLSVSKDESIDFLKQWKKKEVPKDKVIPLYNYILKRCSIKALQLEEDLGLPPHMPVPQVKPTNN
jgi:hypothetical protein